jgi:hypothetical protein
MLALLDWIAEHPFAAAGVGLFVFAVLMLLEESTLQIIRAARRGRP